VAQLPPFPAAALYSDHCWAIKARGGDRRLEESPPAPQCAGYRVRL